MLAALRNEYKAFQTPGTFNSEQEVLNYFSGDWTMNFYKEKFGVIAHHPVFFLEIYPALWASPQSSDPGAYFVPLI